MFRATNIIGTSEDSTTVRYALVDPPVLPTAPTVMYSFSNETQIAVQWAPFSPTSPGDEIFGYILEVMDTANVVGSFEVVFDGSSGFPNSLSYVYTNVSAGKHYLFRVKAAYLNGFTSYTTSSLPVYACSPPSFLEAPSLYSVSET